MKPEYESLLRHTLGAERESGVKSRHDGFRNYYVCGDSWNKNFVKFQQMEQIGLVEMYGAGEERLVCFRATLSGARAIGLGKAALIRAGLLEAAK